MTIAENHSWFDSTTADIEKLLDVLGSNSIRLGGVEFFRDADGPFKGVLSYDKPSDTWNCRQVQLDLIVENIGEGLPWVDRMLNPNYPDN